MGLKIWQMDGMPFLYEDVIVARGVKKKEIVGP